MQLSGNFTMNTFLQQTEETPWDTRVYIWLILACYLIEVLCVCSVRSSPTHVWARVQSEGAAEDAGHEDEPGRRIILQVGLREQAVEVNDLEDHDQNLKTKIDQHKDINGSNISVFINRSYYLRLCFLEDLFLLRSLCIIGVRINLDNPVTLLTLHF